MGSPQALSEPDRRLAAAWAADCAEHVLPLYTASVPDDQPVRELIARAQAYARGELSTADEIRRRFVGGVATADVKAPAALAAAQSAGQAVAVCHMGAHALGAAGYAVQAATLADPARREEEISWQLQHLPSDTRAALRSLPLLGTDRSGPLGPGLLANGMLGDIIRELQARLGVTG